MRPLQGLNDRLSALESIISINKVTYWQICKILKVFVLATRLFLCYFNILIFSKLDKDINRHKRTFRLMY